MRTITFITFALLMGSWHCSNNHNASINKNEMKKSYNSPNYTDGSFQNLETTPVMHPDSSTLKVAARFLKNGENRMPDSAINTIPFNREQFLANKNGITICWFGHSTALINVDGFIILTDPVFSKHASPLGFTGNKSFDYSNPVSVNDLPNIDVVLISHDHYDHLDKKTIKKLIVKTNKFVVPLGLSFYLKKWKVPDNQISELDWYDTIKMDNGSKIICTPARHFSGRGLKRNTTLWCSYVIEHNQFKLYFSGDSGYGKHFKLIGDQYGPFDIAFLECGQYNPSWPFIHMLPHEIPMAMADLKAKRILPLHWAKFKLSLHSWTEPVELLQENIQNSEQVLLTPEINNSVKIDSVYTNKIWWK